MHLVEIDTATYKVLSVTLIEESMPVTRMSDSLVLAVVAPDVGDVYDPVLGIFGDVPRRKWLTKLAFDNRFTMTEAVALKIAQSYPTRLVDETDQAYNTRCAVPAQLQVMAGRLAMASYIDLEREDTIAGVMALEQFGLLAVGRATAILTDPIAAYEYHPDA